MTAVFADSSALVKLYADETHADAIRALSTLIISQLARVEVPSALWRKHRLGDLTSTDAQVLVSAFEADYFGTQDEKPRFLVIGTTTQVLDDAARLVAVHGLRAYDGVQLASACAVHASATEGLTFSAFDKKLCTAASAEGLDLLVG